MASRAPRLSVVCVLRGDATIACLDHGATDTEFVVVGPTAPHGPPGVQHVRCTSGSLARGLNRGLREAKGEYLLLIDPQYRVPVGTFDACVRVLQAQQASGFALLGCPLRRPDGNPLPARHPIMVWPRLRNAIFDNRLLRKVMQPFRGPSPDTTDNGGQRSCEVTAVQGCFLLFHRSLLAEVGPLDPDFAGQAALLEWQYRVRCRGYRIWFSADVHVVSEDQEAVSLLDERLDRALCVLKLYRGRGYATYVGLRHFNNLCHLLAFPWFDSQQRCEIREELSIARRTGAFELSLPLLYAPHFASAWSPLSSRPGSHPESPLPGGPEPWSPEDLTALEPLTGRASAAPGAVQTIRANTGPARKGLQTPVLLLIFNRPDLVEKQLKLLREVQVRNLFVVADGPRPHHTTDTTTCLASRELLAGIDWDCRLETQLLPSNLGCHELIPRAISWFFRRVEFGIIIEDDCLADPSFFPMCADLGKRYSASKVMAIAGSNFQRGRHRGEPQASYYFSRYTDMWGWASWRRAWRHYRHGLPGLEEFLRSGQLEQITGSRQMAGLWARRLRQVASEPRWDYHWIYSIWRNDGLCVFPNQNLISNVGFREDGTTVTPSMKGPFSEMPVHKLGPLRHPTRLVVDRQADAFVTHGRFGLEELLLPAVPGTWLARLQHLVASWHGVQDPFRETRSRP